MDDEEKSFLRLLYEQQPNIFYLSLAMVLSIIIFYFLSRWYFFGFFSLQENMKITFYLILQFSLIFYEFYQTFKQCDIIQLSIFIFPISFYHLSLCSYIKLESIIASNERFSKKSNKRLVRMIVCMIFLFGFIEGHLFIINNKFNLEPQVETTFFIIDKVKVLPVKKSFIVSLFHAQTMNLFTLLNHIAFMVCIQLRLSSLFMINFNWFLNSLHELFQTFLSIYLSENIIRAIPDAIFHASFALFYFLKQKAFATLVQAIKEIFLIFWNDDDDNNQNKENEENKNEELDVEEMFNEIVDDDNETKSENEVDIDINLNQELNNKNELNNNSDFDYDENSKANEEEEKDDN